MTLTGCARHRPPFPTARQLTWMPRSLLCGAESTFQVFLGLVEVSSVHLDAMRRVA